MAVKRQDLELATELLRSGVVGDELGDVDIVGDELDELGDVDIVGDDELGDVDIVGDDELGDVDIVGDDELGALDDEIGASVNAQTKAMATKLARRMIAKRGSPVAVQRNSGSIKTAFLKFVRDADNTGFVNGGAQAEIQATPQHPFRPTGLVIDDESAKDFLINDIKLGVDSLLADGGPIPATQFRGDSILNKLLAKTGQTSEKFTLVVTNRSADSRPFYADMPGWGRR